MDIFNKYFTSEKHSNLNHDIDYAKLHNIKYCNPCNAFYDYTSQLLLLKNNSFDGFSNNSSNELFENPSNELELSKNPSNELFKSFKSLYYMMAGLMAGYCGAIVVYPIDVVKTHMQISNSPYKNGIECIKHLIKTNGIKSFYKGSIIQLMGVGPEKAVKIYVNNYVLEKLPKSNTSNIMAGALAGSAQVLITNPIEILKIQCQLNRSIKLEIIKNLYKGVKFCLARDMPFSAIYFPTYSYIKSNIINSGFIAGTLSAIPAAYLVTPFDVIKTQIQSNQSNQTTNQIIKLIYKKNKINGFFKGGLWRVGKSAPQFGITLSIYEFLTN